ncbi:unnamed protein product [Phyllotreta striolata]|uniref:Ras GTPase-activating protein n=1 Tax=Phyllotreta striolata TaxID=444603 RepID=A0A9N9TTK4_PHYSR|nr:unnamed protein product [Phyllotreta striolata]
MADDFKGVVRIEERLKIKIGEVKNLPERHGSATQRDVYCTLTLDQEEIFRTCTVYQTLSPFFGEEFQFEVPRNFRFVSVYVMDKDRHTKQDKVLGKVAIKREELSSYNNKEHWFAIRAVDADSEVQGKANIDIKFDEGDGHKRRLLVQVVECLDLTQKNGSCDPYASVCVRYANGKTVTKRTRVRKKTTSPRFDDVFAFASAVDGSKETTGVGLEGGACDADICELTVSMWHDAPALSEDVFLGEVRVALRGAQQQNFAQANAWYYLQPRPAKNQPIHSRPPGTRLSKDSPLGSSLGSLRLHVQYAEDRVFPAKVYEDLKNLLLESTNIQPVTFTSVYVLGEIVNKMDIAQPLVRIYLHYEKIVPVIKALANVEISKVTDPTTIFRGNTLVSKMMDETMKLVGLQYLHKTLRPTLELILNEKKPCEIDQTRVKDANTVANNLTNLKHYIQKIFEAITQSAVHCPALMCQIFYNLKECAMKHFPDDKGVRYSVISGFIFLRFFAPAILGPKLFDLTSQPLDNQTGRTLTLISKTIQSLGNVVSCRSTQQMCKEEYMEGLYKEFYTEKHKTAVRQFLEIISASSSGQQVIENDTPVTLKEGVIARDIKKITTTTFLKKELKFRYFKLTTHDLSYSKKRGKVSRIPLHNILAVEKLAESSFNQKYMFQIVQPNKKLYFQAANCVEEKEWVDLLTKICQTNANRLQKYHPCAFINNQWRCCKSPNELAPGCSEVSQIDNNYRLNLDPERDLQRVQSLIVAHSEQFQYHIAYYKSKSAELRDVLERLWDAAVEIDRKHSVYKRTAARATKVGSLAAPIGDDNYLLASRLNVRRCVSSEPTSCP